MTLDKQIAELSIWQRLWFTFWVYLVIGAISLLFVHSAALYYYVEGDLSELGSVLTLIGPMLLSLIHASSAWYFVWNASHQEEAAIRILARLVAIFYFVLVLIGVLFSAYAFLFVEFP